MGADAKEYASQIKAFNARVVALSKADEAELAKDDIARLALWLEEAERLLADREVREAGWRLKRVEYGVELVTELVEASHIKAEADKQRAAYDSAQTKIDELGAQIETLRAKKTQLTAQLGTLR